MDKLYLVVCIGDMNKYGEYRMFVHCICKKREQAEQMLKDRILGLSGKKIKDHSYFIVEANSLPGGY